MFFIFMILQGAVVGAYMFTLLIASRHYVMASYYSFTFQCLDEDLVHGPHDVARLL